MFSTVTIFKVAFPEREWAFVISAGLRMADTTVACQIAILVQVSFEMELLVKLLVLFVVIEFIDR